MSDNVRSHGFMAVICSELPGWEELNEKLWREKSPLRVNYEGTVAYTDMASGDDIYGLFIGDVKSRDAATLVDECGKYGIYIDIPTIKPYNCIWYNGSDSPMAELTKKEFLEA